MDFTWISSSAYAGIPPNAVFAGQDSDGDTIFVGRAYYQGDMMPAKIIPNKRTAYVSHGGEEISLGAYEILCGQGFTWVASSGGSVPPQAVVGGQTSDGEPLFIGRGHYEGSLTPGKVHQSHGCLYLPYGGAERRLDHYECLVSTDAWIQSAGRTDVPPGAVFAGSDSDGDAIYVGRSYHEGDLLPAKVIPSKMAAYVSHAGMEISKHEYEILCGNGFTWVGCASGHVPSGAVSAGNTIDGEILYIGRGHFEGSLTPGKVHPSHGCLYIPYGGAERRLSDYEVLVRSSY